MKHSAYIFTHVQPHFKTSGPSIDLLCPMLPGLRGWLHRAHFLVMNIELKTVGGSVIFSGDFTCLADCVKAALGAGKLLSEANLCRANLSEAYLCRANLSGAYLCLANLSEAYLCRANLSEAYLCRANLSEADLSGANLFGADLSEANLCRANLSGANLSGAYLPGANPCRANLKDAKNADLAIAKTRILPDGDLVGWKKLADGVIAKLVIPAKAKRSHALGRKCRAEFAKVLALYKEGEAYRGAGKSTFSPDFTYRVGKIVKPKQAFDENWQEECASGIHFFITRAEAEAY